MRLLLGLVVFFIASCAMAPPTADELALREERAVDREIAKEQRAYDRKVCSTSGGVLYVEQWSGNRPHKRDRVRCISRKQAIKVLR